MVLIAKWTLLKLNSMRIAKMAFSLKSSINRKIQVKGFKEIKIMDLVKLYKRSQETVPMGLRIKRL